MLKKIRTTEAHAKLPGCYKKKSVFVHSLEEKSK